MSTKPMLLVASKIDAASDARRLAALRQLADREGKPLYEVSGVTGAGLEELKRAAWEMLGSAKCEV